MQIRGPSYAEDLGGREKNAVNHINLTQFLVFASLDCYGSFFCELFVCKEEKYCMSVRT